jgi:hypothetical protein
MNGTRGPAGEARESRTPTTPPAIKRMRAGMTAGTVLVLLLLAVFAYSLVDSQRKARDDVEHRFEDVAQVSAAMTAGLFQVSQAGSMQQAVAQLGGRRVDPRRLAALARRNDRPYAAVFDARGRRLAATGRAPTDASAEVRRALSTGRAQLSDAVGRGPGAVVEWAIPYRSAGGPRIYLTALRLRTLGAFLGGFLRRVPNFAGAQSEVLDRRGTVLGGTHEAAPLGRPLRDRELLRALADGRDGAYADERYFASAPIAGSPWRVAISTSQDDLYDSVTGSRTTVPWLLFAAFAIAALIGLAMMRRSALTAAELQRRELSERHAVEINDNIIQGLALASYDLERGDASAGASQVTATLQEAQRLVSELLGEAEVEPGRLRRRSAAEVSRRPTADGETQDPDSPPR